jgi:hypothetical protein
MAKKLKRWVRCWSYNGWGTVTVDWNSTMKCPHCKGKGGYWK